MINLRNLFKQKKVQIAVISLFIFITILGLSIWYRLSMHYLTFFGDDDVDYNSFQWSSFLEYIYRSDSQYFRPITWIFMYVSFSIHSISPVCAIIFNCFIFTLPCLALFYLLVLITNKKILPTMIVFVFTFSWLNLYLIAYTYGIMESLALLFLFLILIFVIKFQVSEKRIHYITILLFSILICLVAERFFIIFMLSVFLPIFIFKDVKRKWVYTSLGGLLFLSYSFIRVFALGKPFLINTAGGDITFDILLMFNKVFVSFMWSFQFPYHYSMFDNIHIFFKFITFLTFIILFIIFIFSFIIFIKSICLKKKKVYLFSIFLLINMALYYGMMSFTQFINPRFLSSVYSLVIIFICFEISNYEYIFGHKLLYATTHPLRKTNFILASLFLLVCTNNIGYIKKDGNTLSWIYTAEKLYKSLYEPYSSEYLEKPLIIFAESEFKVGYLRCYPDQLYFPHGFKIEDYEIRYDYIAHMTEYEYNHTVLISVNNDLIFERL